MATLARGLLPHHRMEKSKNVARRRRPKGGWDDVLYDAFFSAGIGGSIVALLFLLVDVMEGRPFFTPSLIGSVLFLGIPADQVRDVRLDVVAYYTLIHLAGCGVCGLVVSLAVRRAERRSRYPSLLLLGTFLVLEVGFYAGASRMAPGVMERVGGERIAVVNLFAAMGVAAFLLTGHRPRAPRWLRRSRTTA